MFDFDHNLSQLSGVTVLCIGDLMLDDFVYGEVARISPEAPAPVIAVKRSEMVIGGAGNVARNIASLGARCLFVGLIGEDDAGRTLKAALAAEPRIEADEREGGRAELSSLQGTRQLESVSGAEVVAAKELNRGVAENG